MKKIFIIAVAILFLSPNVFARWDDDSGGGSPFTSLQAENIGDVTPGDATFNNLQSQNIGNYTSGNATFTTVYSSGNVGIGTDAPTGKLDVTSSSYPVQRLTRTSTVTDAVRATAAIRHETTNDMVDGFGPSLLFEAKDSSGSTNTLSGISGVRDGADNTGGVNIQTYNNALATDRIYVRNSGNVGIGVADPSTLLEVGGALTATTGSFTGITIDGTAGFTGSCANGTDLTVVDGIITACS